jgi:hypothetical protein
LEKPPQKTLRLSHSSHSAGCWFSFRKRRKTKHNIPSTPDTHFTGKVVSMFEPQTEVIRKGKASKPTEFGKMVKIQEAENQIITGYEVYDKRRPYDSDLLVQAVAEHCDRLGQGSRARGGRRGLLFAEQ